MIIPHESVQEPDAIALEPAEAGLPRMAKARRSNQLPTQAVNPVAPEAPKQSSGLGTASLVLGIVALLFCWIPILNMLSLLMAMIGGLLGIAALVPAMRYKKTSLGSPIAGTILCGVSLLVVIAMYAVVGAATTEIVKTQNKIQKEIEKERNVVAAKGDPNMHPTPKKSADGVTRVGIDKPFRVGNIAYAIGGYKTFNEIGSAFHKIQASDGAVFLVVAYAIKNISNETKTVITDNMILVDAQGRRFKKNSRATAAHAMASGDKDILLSELQPGIQKNTLVLYEVPKNSVGPGLKIEVPAGMFSKTPAAIVSLDGGDLTNE